MTCFNCDAAIDALIELNAFEELNTFFEDDTDIDAIVSDTDLCDDDDGGDDYDEILSDIDLSHLPS